MKIGRLTAALLLLSTGILLLLQQLTGDSWISYLGHWWPAAVIALGVEWLVLAALPPKSGAPSRRIDIGGLAVAVILAMGIYGYSQSKDGFSMPDWIPVFSSVAQETGSPARTWNETIGLPAGMKSVWVANETGNVTIRKGDVQDLVIDAAVYVDQLEESKIGEVAESAKVTGRAEGDRLRIAVEAPKYHSSFFGFSRKARVNLVLTVPDDRELDWDMELVNGKIAASELPVAERFNARTTNGSIQLSGLDGQVSANTTNGDIALLGVRGEASAETTNGEVKAEAVDGNLELKSTNGRIQAADVRGDAELRTTNGEIKLNGVTGKLNARTVNGDLHVDSPEVGGDWQLKTNNGTIELLLPRDGSYRVKGESRWAETDLNLLEDRGDISGEVGGGRYLIEAETNIRLYVKGRN